jgi:uncharacterized phage protein (TIGR02220 family)
MGAYRQIKVSFWSDSFVLELKPEERGFFLYLLTNPSTTQCGIYELSLKMIVMQFGYTEDVIIGLIQQFVQWGKICYNPGTHEFLILNWLKHNQSDNPSVVRCIEKELALVRTPEFKSLRLRCLQGHDTTTTPYSHHEDTTTTPLSKVKEVKLIQDHEKITKEEEILKEEENKDQENKTNDQDLSLEIFPNPHLGEETSETDLPPLFLPHELIIQHLNLMTHTNYKVDSETTRLYIENKMSQGFGLGDFFTVIDKKATEWMGTELEGNLTPHILFTDKFEAYLEQKIGEKKKYKGSNRLDPAEFKNMEFMEVNG